MNNTIAESKVFCESASLIAQASKEKGIEVGVALLTSQSNMLKNTSKESTSILKMLTTKKKVLIPLQ